MQILKFINDETVEIENLRHLCDYLNKLEHEVRQENHPEYLYGIGDILDITSLPVFSDNEIKNPDDIYSWDDTHQLIKNYGAVDSQLKNYWLIVEREDLKGDKDEE